MLKVWYGDEPYLINRLKSKEKELVESPELNITDNASPLTDELFTLAYTVPFWGGKRYIVAYEDDLKNPLLAKLIEDEPENEVRVIVRKFESNLKVAKSLDEDHKQQFPRLTPAQFDIFMKKQVRDLPIRIRQSEYDYLLKRIAYGKREGCDLMQVEGWCRLLSCFCEATREIIDHVICEDESSANSFELYNMLVQKRGRDYFDTLEKLLARDDAIKLMSLLLYNFRIAYKVSLVGRSNAASEIGTGRLPAGNITGETAEKAMALLQDGCNRIKRGEDSRYVITIVSAKLMGIV